MGMATYYPPRTPNPHQSVDYCFVFRCRDVPVKQGVQQHAMQKLKGFKDPRDIISWRLMGREDSMQPS